MPYYNYNNLKQNFSSPVLNYPNLNFQRGHLNNLNVNFENAQNLNNINNNNLLNQNYKNLNNNYKINLNNENLNNNNLNIKNNNLNYQYLNSKNDQFYNEQNEQNSETELNSKINQRKIMNNENNNDSKIKDNSFDIENLMGNNNLNLNKENKNLTIKNVNKTNYNSNEKIVSKDLNLNNNNFNNNNEILGDVSKNSNLNIENGIINRHINLNSNNKNNLNLNKQNNVNKQVNYKNDHKINNILNITKDVHEQNENNKRKYNEEYEDINKKIKYLSNINLVSFNLEELEPPLDFDDIFERPDEDNWLKAVSVELENMKNKNVYTFVYNIPKDKNVISCRWVFTYKRNDKGEIVKYKARLVARGFSQILGIDYIETFSPTLKQDSLRIITALAVHYNFNIYQLDIKAAYLNAELKEELYMEIPEGDENFKKGYWKLNKAIYGLKQAGRMWNFKINDTLIELGFIRCKSEPCVYVKKDNNNNVICILAIYVDDILIAGR